MKTRMYEAVMDERDAPKPAPKPIEQWDHTELRRAMMDDARKIKSPDAYKNKSAMKGNTQERIIEAMREIGRPCSRQEIAEKMCIANKSARNYVRTVIVSGHVTTDRHKDGKTVLYALTEGYDGQKLLEL